MKDMKNCNCTLLRAGNGDCGYMWAQQRAGR